MKKYVKKWMPKDWIDGAWILFFVSITVFRLILATKGHLYWIDELRYLNAFLVVDSVAHNNWKDAIGYYLFNAHARPGYVLLSVFPAALQLLALKFHLFDLNAPNFIEGLKQMKIPMKFDPAVFDISAFFNVLAVMGVMILFYKIVYALTKERKWALLGTVVLSLLTNTNLYIRHMVPYSYSLFFYLWIVYIILADDKKWRTIPSVLGLGMLAAFAFSIYPSYYILVGIIGFLILYFSGSFKLSFFYGLGFFAIIAFVEGLSRLGIFPFIESCRQLSETVNQGDFSEGFIFPLRYLLDIEGAAGLTIFVFFIFFLLFVLPKSSKQIKALFILFLLGFVYHASMGFFFKKFVFYGRILHMYYPVLVLGAILALRHITSNVWRRVAVGVLMAASIGSFIFFAVRFLPLTYPLEFQNRYLKGIPSDWITHVEVYKEVNPDVFDYAGFVVVNAVNLQPVFDPPIAFNISSEFILLKSINHPVHFKAYQYEGHTPAERKRLRARHFNMEIYVRKAVVQSIQEKQLR